MKKAKTYREYKADCIRIAQLMSAKDKEVLLKMAEAWEDRAREAERQERKAEAKSEPDVARDQFESGIIGGFDGDALRPRGNDAGGPHRGRCDAPLKQRSNARRQIWRCSSRSAETLRQLCGAANDCA